MLTLTQGGEATVPLRQIQDELANNLGKVGNEARSNLVQETLAQAGDARELNLGTTQQTAMTKAVYSAKSQALYGGALSLAGGPANLLGLGFGAAKGYVMPGWSAFIRESNNALNETFREAAFQDEFWGKLMPAAVDAFKAVGADLSGLSRDELAVDAVTRRFGTTTGAQWARVQRNTVDLAASRTRFLFGDYVADNSAAGYIQKLIGPGIPFASWAVRAYPVALEMAVRHPLVAMGVYQYLKATSQNAGKDGVPAYTAGSIPISTETPILGLAARGLLGGQKGTAYVDPIGSIAPFGSGQFQPQDELAPNPSLYQKVGLALNKVGMPGFNPLVGALAYILGLDYQAPQGVSRTAGIENGLALLPGGIPIPDFVGAGERALRAQISPKFATTALGQAVGALPDANPTYFDPVARHFGELVVATTGKPLADVANRAYVFDLAAGTGPLYEQARREVLLASFAKNAFSVASPIAAAPWSDQARAARAARLATPNLAQLQANSRNAALLRQEQAPGSVVAPGSIEALIGQLPTKQAQQALKRQQTEYVDTHPWAGAYDVGTRDRALSLLMQDVADRYTFRGQPVQPSSPQGPGRVLAQLQAEAEARRATPTLVPIPAKR